MKKLLAVLMIVALAFISCKNDKKATMNSESTTLKEVTILIDSLIYSIATIQSANVDSLENEAFKLFLQEKLINFIFEQIYEGKLKAYDFLSDKELSIDEIKKFEKTEGFRRSKVGKVQFNEQWYVDKDGALNIRVKSLTFGIEHFSNQGNFINYNALFKVKF